MSRGDLVADQREAVSFRIFDDNIDRVVAGGRVVGFVDVAGARVVVGSGVASSARPHIYFGVELDDGADVPDDAYVVGELPWWTPGLWAERAAATRSIRTQLRRATNKGVRVRRCVGVELEANTPLRAALDAMVEGWLRTRHLAPLGFVAEVRPFSRAGERVYFVAEVVVAGHVDVVGFAVASPIAARGSWSIDHVVRRSDAPNGTSEALIDAAMRVFADEGAREVTLGLCPLAGRVPATLAWVCRLSRGLYDFRGLSDFKAKLRPDRWQRVLVVHPGQHALPATWRALRAFAGGSLVSFAVRSTLRGPPMVLRTIAALLVPWTLLLATPAASTWFPSSSVQRSWVTFDVIVTAALVVLARRVSRRVPQRRLHGALALAVTADALLTAFEAGAWNLPRVHSVGAMLVVLIAWTAPLVAAVMLWTARRHREPQQKAA